jgi:hypothetical protein
MGASGSPVIKNLLRLTRGVMHGWVMLLLLCMACSGDQPSTENKVAVPAVIEAAAPDSISENVLVYITDTGEKYHRNSCYYLRKSKKEISLPEAVRLGYEPCKVCEPPR